MKKDIVFTLKNYSKEIIDGLNKIKNIPSEDIHLLSESGEIYFKEPI